VTINGESVGLIAYQYSSLEFNPEDSIHVETRSNSGELIESFNPEYEEYKYNYIYNVAQAAALITYNIKYGAYDQSQPTVTELGAKRWFAGSYHYTFTNPPRSIKTSNRGVTRRSVLEELRDLHPELIRDYIESDEEFERLVKMHAIWDESSDIFTIQYLRFAANYSDFDSIIEKRMALFPYDVVTLRAAQDHGSAQLKNSLCLKFGKRVLASPNNSDHYYLNCRCMEAGAKQDSAFAKGLEQWPKHPWLCLASGVSEDEVGHYKQALYLFLEASNGEPILAQSLSLTIHRLFHYTESTLADIGPWRLPDPSPYLEYLLALEAGTGEMKQSIYHAYALTENGYLTMALEHIRLHYSQEQEYQSVLQFVGASSGADSDMIDNALNPKAIPLLTDITLLPTVGLALREGKDIELYRAQIETIFPENVDDVFRFAEAAKSKKFKAANKILDNTSIVLHGLLCIMGIVILEDDAPEKWTSDALKITYTGERPFFPKPTGDSYNFTKL
jgi:hypothetical protein